MLNTPYLASVKLVDEPYTEQIVDHFIGLCSVNRDRANLSLAVSFLPKARRGEYTPAMVEFLVDDVAPDLLKHDKLSVYHGNRLVAKGVVRMVQKSCPEKGDVIDWPNPEEAIRVEIE